MKILYSPQQNNEKISYSFNGEIITASYKNVTDTFDFTGLTDGISVGVETTLEINPIINAERINGILQVELINFIGADATEDEKYPIWQEV